MKLYQKPILTIDGPILHQFIKIYEALNDNEKSRSPLHHLLCPPLDIIHRIRILTD